MDSENRTRRGPKIKVTAAQKEEARRLYELGKSLRQIGTELGISHERVRAALKELKVEIRPPAAKLSEEDKRSVVREYVVDKIGTTTLGDKYGVSSTAIRSIVKNRARIRPHKLANLYSGPRRRHT